MSPVEGLIIAIFLWGFTAYLVIKRVDLMLIAREKAMKIRWERQNLK